MEGNMLSINPYSWIKLERHELKGIVALSVLKDLLTYPHQYLGPEIFNNTLKEMVLNYSH